MISIEVDDRSSSVSMSLRSLHACSSYSQMLLRRTSQLLSNEERKTQAPY